MGDNDIVNVVTFTETTYLEILIYDIVIDPTVIDHT